MRFGYAIGLWLAFSITLTADENWNQFRGANASGVAEKSAPPSKLDLKTGVKWKVPVPAGFSSPVVWGDRLFLTGFDQNKLWTLCYSTKDGSELWKVEAPAKKIEEFHKTEGSPAASSVATDGKNVIAYFGSCGMFCYDLAGKPKWQFLLPTAETNNRFGTGTSPIVVDGVVYLVRDLLKDSRIYALNADTGDIVWEKSRDGFPTSYSSPIVWKNGDRTEVVVAGYLRMKGYDAKSGAETWTTSNLPGVICTTPVLGEGMLLFAGWTPGHEDFPMPAFSDFLKQGDANNDGAIDSKEAEKTFMKDFFYNNDTNRDGKITKDEWDAMEALLKKGRNSVMAIKSGGKNDITNSHVAWTKTKGLPYVPSPVYYQGRLFLIKDGGLLTAYNAKNGKEIYVQERIGGGDRYYASPVAANGHLYLLSLDGLLTVVKADGDEPTVVSQIKLGERTPATPAIAHDFLFVRTATQLYAFGK